MKNNDRNRFDQELKLVLGQMPTEVREMLEEVPLVVEDYPSDQVCDAMNLEFRDDICGRYQGVALIHRSVDPSTNAAESDLPESIQIFREGLVATSRNKRGAVSVPELRRRIRVTILHEIGHRFGMDERELKVLSQG